MGQPPLEYEQFRKETADIISSLQSFEVSENSLVEAEIDALRLSRKLLTNLARNIEAFETTKLQFRPNQIQGFQALRSFLADASHGNLRGYFQQPTGAGKTIFFGAIVKMLDVNTLILVPKTVLLNQTSESFMEMLGIPESDIGIIGDKIHQLGRKFTISTYQSHISNINKDDDYANLMSNVELVICDEAHRSLGEKTQNTLEVFDYSEDEELTEEEMRAEEELLDNTKQYTGKSALVLGFTATPQLRVKQVKKHFNTLISRISYEELIGMGILVSLKVFQDNAYLETGEAGYITEEEEGEILEREDVYRKLLQRFTNQRAGKLAGIQLNPAVFCVNIKECQKFQQIAAEFDYKSMIITSKIGKNSLEEAEEKLLRGEIDFIITVDKLTEGWDFPPLNAVMLARASRSPARIIQAVGRGMRCQEGKDNCYIFEANWKVRGKRSRENEYTQLENDPEISLAEADNSEAPKRTRKALTIAQALADLGENVEAICTGAEGVLEFIQNIEVDKNGIGKALVNDEEIEVVARCGRAVDYYSVSPTTLAKYLEEIKPIPGHEARISSSSVSIYKKSEVDELFFYVKNAVGVVTINGEEIEVITRSKLAADHYGISWSFLNRKMTGLAPLPGYKVKAGTKSVLVYRKSEVDELLPYVKVDENGMGTVTIDGEEIEVVARCGAAADYYGISSTTFVKRIKTLNPVPEYQAMAGAHTIYLYKKSEVDAIFPRVTKIEIDKNGIGIVTIDSEEIKVAACSRPTAEHYGIELGTFSKKVKILTLIPGYAAQAGPLLVSVYRKSEVDALFPYIKADENGMGTVTIDGEEIEVVARCSGSASYYGISLGTFSKKVKTLTPIPNYQAKLGIRPTELYKKSEVDVLFPKREKVEIDRNGRGVATIDGEEIEVVACMAGAAKYYNTSRSTLTRELKALTPVSGYEAKSGTRFLLLYKKSETDPLFPRETTKIEMNENGIGTVTINDEEIEVVANGKAAAGYYGVTRKTLRGKLKKLTPISAYKAKSGSQSTSIYKKSEVDFLFKK